MSCCFSLYIMNHNYVHWISIHVTHINMIYKSIACSVNNISTEKTNY